MARDVEFESERFEKRLNARRYWIPAVVLLVMIGVAVVVALLTRSGRGGTFVGEQAAYPYSWTEEKDGSITLELDLSNLEGCLWTVVDADEVVAIMEADGTVARTTEDGVTAVLTVQPAKKQPKDKLLIVLTPVSVGRATFTMGLLNASDPDDCDYELTVFMEVRVEKGKLNAYLISAGGKMFQDAVQGEGADYAYTAMLNESDNLVITVTDKKYAQPEEENNSEEEETPAAVTEGESEEEPEDSFDPNAALYFGYTWEEYMALPDEERDELIAAHRAELAEQGLLDEPPAPSEEELSYGWQCVSDNEAVAQVLTVIYEGESSSAYLLPGRLPGKASVKMTSPDSKTEITLACEVDANGDFLITSHNINH